MMFLDVPSNFGLPGVFNFTNSTSEDEIIWLMKSVKMGTEVGQLFEVMTGSSTVGYVSSHSLFWPFFSFPILKKIFCLLILKN